MFALLNIPHVTYDAHRTVAVQLRADARVQGQSFAQVAGNFGWKGDALLIGGTSLVFAYAGYHVFGTVGAIIGGVAGLGFWFLVFPFIASHTVEAS